MIKILREEELKITIVKAYDVEFLIQRNGKKWDVYVLTDNGNFDGEYVKIRETRTKKEAVERIKNQTI